MESSNITQELSSIKTRAYQQELLEESRHKNIIIALDTGSGKTHIAIMRMREMTEQQPDKVCWFLAPTVMLCDQQRHIIKTCLPVPVAQVNGQLQPDQWKDRKMWRSVVDSHMVVVSTPQVLLDALRHGYLNLGCDISMLVFDEAHHAVDDHPYNRIMAEFYHTIPTSSQPPCCRPQVLGLTASPVYGGNLWKAFQAIQTNLDARVRTSRRNKQELATFVFRPTYKHILYPSPSTSEFSTNLASLQWVQGQLDIQQDPYVRLLRKQLDAPNMEPTKRRRLDQKLSKAILKGDTYTHKGIRDFAAGAQSVNDEVGPWAADWYVYHVITRARESIRPFGEAALTTDEEEKIYLINALQRVQANEPSPQDDDFLPGCSAKVNQLIEHLLDEKESCASRGDRYSGLVFVQRRDCVIALSEVLRRHPRLASVFNIGSLVGTNDSVYRRDFLDLSRGLLKMTQNDTLDNFKIGEINLIVSTSVAEEGIDIQACCHVVRWDPPPNMASWLQSRGRARQMRSTYALMQLEGSDSKTLDQWRAEEEEMIRYYNADTSPTDSLDQTWFGEEPDDKVLSVPSTGAMLTLPSAVSHLQHFCAAIPHSRYSVYQPIYDIDPPDVPEEWHLTQPSLPPYTGPFGSTVSLPRALPANLREFSTAKRYPNKTSAHRHAAFEAYEALYHAGLLNDHLLPITSVLEPKEEEEVIELLKEVEKRASMTNVSVQMDPWTSPQSPDAAMSDNEWWLSELEISSAEGLDSMQLLTKARPVTWDSDDPVRLYSPNKEPRSVTLRVLSAKATCIEEDELLVAKVYTRRLFWHLYEQKMEWDQLNFAYLILPSDQPRLSSPTPEWLDVDELSDPTLPHTSTSMSAEDFGREYDYPDDIALVKAGSKQFTFVRWHFDPLPQETEDLLRQNSRLVPDGDWDYPLMVVEPLPRRTNFLVPLPPTSISSNHEEPKERALQYMHPRFARVCLVDEKDMERALLCPSIFRAMQLSMTTQSFKATILQTRTAHPSLSSIPTSLLLTAITTPLAQESINYQRLETLGDTALKLLTSIQVLAEHPLWHEGYLSRRKDHAVSNARLAKEAMSRELWQWIIRDRYLGKKWTPKLLKADGQVVAPASNVQSTSIPMDVDPPPNQSSTGPRMGSRAHDHGKKKKIRRTQQLSLKVIADVVESTIGAAYLTGGLPVALECVRVFDLGLRWEDLSVRHQTLYDRALATPQPGHIIPPQLEHVETILSYSFRNKLLLQEALTHSSHQPLHQMADTVSYERMEFLGDAVLDMVATDFMYRAQPPNGKLYKPGHIHLRKSALVNAHFLAYICLRQSCTVRAAMPRPERPAINPTIVIQEEEQQVWLYQCLLHSSHQIVDAQRDVRTRFTTGRDAIDAVLFGPQLDEENTDDVDMTSQAEGSCLIFPWGNLSRLQAPKIFSDMIEALIGAVYIDSLGSIDAVTAVLEQLGWMSVMRRIVDRSIDVQHPISRLHMWAARVKSKVTYSFEKSEGNITCSILVDGMKKGEATGAYTGVASQNQVKFRAAEEFNWKHTVHDASLDAVAHPIR